MSKLEYTGTKLNENEPYLPDRGLVEAVNLAILLQRPLLLKGEPGSGKTRLAGAVAYELDDAPLYSWYIQSTTRAQDGFYHYDALGRLRDAQLAATDMVTVAERDKARNLGNYIEKRQLWRAFKSERRAVVLIDEIDKADIDFPNDLLRVLDEGKFTIPETGEEVEASRYPIIFITSNDEKQLPDAFLRRCIFYYIQFPEPERLYEIVSHHMKQKVTEEDPLLRQAVNRFWTLRRQMVADKQEGVKKISTSELLDWVKALKRMYGAEGQPLPDLTSELLFPSVLLKSKEDMQTYRR